VLGEVDAHGVNLPGAGAAWVGFCREPPGDAGTMGTMTAARRSRWNHAMDRALELGIEAGARGDIPVGAVVLDEAGRVVGEGANRREADADPTAHAEVLALRAAAAATGQWRLEGCTLVVTLEPCTMCAGALVLARVDRLVLGAWDAKAGATGSVRDVVRDSRLNHRVEVVPGVREAECAGVLEEFFRDRR
jgi:tRNA(adenine34) deaminase